MWFSRELRARVTSVRAFRKEGPPTPRYASMTVAEEFSSKVKRCRVWTMRGASEGPGGVVR
jgi:hypothetical protein